MLRTVLHSQETLTQGTERALLHRDGVQRGWKPTHAPWVLPPVGRLGQWAVGCSSTLQRPYLCGRVGVRGSCNPRVGPRLCVWGHGAEHGTAQPGCIQGTRRASLHGDGVQRGWKPARAPRGHAGRPLQRAACCTAAMGWGYQCARTEVRGSYKRTCGCVRGAEDAAVLGCTQGTHRALLHGDGEQRGWNPRVHCGVLQPQEGRGSGECGWGYRCAKAGVWGSGVWGWDAPKAPALFRTRGRGGGGGAAGGDCAATSPPPGGALWRVAALSQNGGSGFTSPGLSPLPPSPRAGAGRAAPPYWLLSWLRRAAGRARHDSQAEQGNSGGWLRASP